SPSTAVHLPGRALHGSTSAQRLLPLANSVIALVSPADNKTVVAITLLVRNGTGATLRPSSSRTTAASRALAPAPPRLSGIKSPATPRSCASARQVSEASAFVSS